MNSSCNNGLTVVVGPNGLEPSTSRFSGVRSNHLSYEPVYAVISNRFGGDGGVRTHDLLLAWQALSQLSYTPILGLVFQGLIPGN